MPTREMLLFETVEAPTAISSAYAMCQTAWDLYEQGPYAISPFVYWVRRGSFQRLPIKLMENKRGERKNVFTPPPDFPLPRNN